MSRYEVGESSCQQTNKSSKSRQNNPQLSSSTKGGKKPPQKPYQLPLPSVCGYCGAKQFRNESTLFCCNRGTIRLTSNSMPQALRELYLENTLDAKHFRQYIMLYNSLFAFTSFGVRKDRELARRDAGIYTFRVQGQVYHFVNDVLPNNERPRYLQLYFYDTDLEMHYRMQASSDLRPTVISTLMRIMEVNPYARFFRTLRHVGFNDRSRIIIRSDPDQDQRTHNAPTVSQVAAILVEDENSVEPQKHDIIVYACSGSSHRISHYYGCYDPLAYPALLPFGETGWHQRIYKHLRGRQRHQECPTFPINDVLVQDVNDLIDAEEEALRSSVSDKKVSCREYYCYRLQIRIREPSILLRCGRLLQQYVVDMYVKIEMTRLDFVRFNQDTIPAELYQGIVDSLHLGQAEASNIGRRLILPPSFIGGPRDMRRRYLDAMALVQRYGKPDIFLTMTCNPSWPEIKQELLPHEEPQNRPDLEARIFRSKLMELKKDIIDKKLFGNVAAFVYVIEFQKRGLPHVHFLIILDSESKIRNPDQYDKHVCAEIPEKEENKHLYEVVVKHMMHGPCGEDNPSCVCMKNGRCKNHYPKEFSATTTNGRHSYPTYRRRRDGKVVITSNGIRRDNRWVIPYNPYLLAKYDCHLNVEVCSTIKAVKYLYKYIYKGHDRVSFTLASDGTEHMSDEISSYQSARWISPPEAAWRIFGFALSHMHPNVVPLQVHLPNMQTMTFRTRENMQRVVDDDRRRRTMLTAFFERNRYDVYARTLLYSQFPEHYVWLASKEDKCWLPRQRGFGVGRMVYACPSEGERHYLRILLANIRGPQSFDDLLTVDNIRYSTFRESAYHRGLLDADNSVEKCLEEAQHFQTPFVLRRLFATLLIYCASKSPRSLWDKFFPSLSEDFSHAYPRNARKVQKLTLKSIRYLIESMDKDFYSFDFGDLRLKESLQEHQMKDIEEERQIPISAADIDAVDLLNTDQKIAYDMIYNRILQNRPGAFFVDGPGGTGKTFLYTTLLANLRMQGFIALAVATSGIAASNMSGGRTANSRFKIPIDTDENKTCNISKQGALAELIRAAKLIIWDEASMAKRQTIEHFEKTLRDICSMDTLFGGKIVVFGGDFRQVLPVISKGTLRDSVDASFVMSPLWVKLEKIHLTQNMRAIHDSAFADFVLRVGDGVPPYESHRNMILPESIVLPYEDDTSVIDRLIDIIYPEVGNILWDPYMTTTKAILTPKNVDTQTINSILVSRQPGHAYEYKSFDEAVDNTAEQYPVEFLNSLHPSGFPPHHLVLKKNSPVILLRNLDPTSGLCNGTRLICKAFFPNVIDAEIAVGHHKGERVFIPRIPVQPSRADKYPFFFKRKQFPIKLSFAMTINKAQGQTLDKVGIYLPQPVFSHGQLYVALSRAKRSSDITLAITPTDNEADNWNKTKNIVCYEVLRYAGIL